MVDFYMAFEAVFVMYMSWHHSKGNHTNNEQDGDCREEQRQNSILFRSVWAQRRHHPLTTMDEIATSLDGSKVFTLLDCRSGFWQIPITERLAFGLASAPEVFKKLMQDLLIDIPGVEVSMDDILVHAPNEAQLDELLQKRYLK
jgi:hypothetical protein